MTFTMTFNDGDFLEQIETIKLIIAIIITVIAVGLYIKTSFLK